MDKPFKMKVIHGIGRYYGRMKEKARDSTICERQEKAGQRKARLVTAQVLRPFGRAM